MIIQIHNEINADLASYVTQTLRNQPRKPAQVFVNSYGGCVASGISIFNALKNHPGGVKVIVEGVAASSATLICCAARCSAYENTVFMIHATAVNLGPQSIDGLKSGVASLERFTQSIALIYAEKTHRPVDEVLKLLVTDNWLDAAEAKNLGLIDEIIPTQSPKVFNLGTLKLPRRLATMIVENSLTPVAMDTHVPIAAVDIVRMVNAAKEPALAEMLLATPHSLKEVEARIAQAKTIRNICAIGHLPEMADGLIMSGVTEDDAKRITWDALVARDRSTPIDTTPPISRHTVSNPRHYNCQRPHFVEAASTALAVRMGANPKRIQSGNEFQDTSLTGLAAMVLNANGQSPVGMTRATVVKNAMTTTDFPNLLSYAAEKSLIDRFEAIAVEHREWCSNGSLPDFKSHRVVNTSFLPGLVRKYEAEEISYGTISEGMETIQLATFARGLALTRETLINDDLSHFQDIINSTANAAARTERDLVYAILTGNPAMSDSFNLFSTNHHNLDTTHAAIDVAGLSRARTLMRKQLDASGGYVMTQPRFLLCPVALESEAEALVAGLTYKTSTSGEIETPSWVRSLVVVADPRLDAVDETDWYLVSAPAIAPVIRLSYLNNATTPIVEQQNDFDRDIAKFKVRFDVGVAAIGWAGAVKMS